MSRINRIYHHHPCFIYLPYLVNGSNNHTTISHIHTCTNHLPILPIINQDFFKTITLIQCQVVIGYCRKNQNWHRHKKVGQNINSSLCHWTKLTRSNPLQFLSTGLNLKIYSTIVYMYFMLFLNFNINWSCNNILREITYN